MRQDDHRRNDFRQTRDAQFLIDIILDEYRTGVGVHHKIGGRLDIVDPGPVRTDRTAQKLSLIHI